MERINTAFCIWEILLYAVCDPTCAVAGHYLDGCALLWSQLFAELLQNRLAVILCSPDNGIGLVVYNNCDVAVPFTVAGFIDPDFHSSVKTDVDIRFEIFVDSCDTSADSTPVNPHIFGDGTAAEILPHPGDGVIEVFSKARIRESPWDIGGLDAMLLAANTRKVCLDVNKDSTEIQRPPALFLIRSVIDPGITLAAYRASPLQTLAQMYFDQDT